MQQIIQKVKFDAVHDFTWDDLAGLFLGFVEEPLLSGKKKPDILFFITE